MIIKLEEQLPWWPVTSTIMIATKEDISWVQRRTPTYVECIFYFDSSQPERVREIFKKIEKGIQEAIITDCTDVDMLFNTAIAIRRFRNPTE